MAHLNDVIPIDLTPPMEERYRAEALISLVRLHWFIRLRWFIVVAAFVVLGVEWAVGPEFSRPRGLALIILGIVAVNVVWTVLSRLLSKSIENGQAESKSGVRSATMFANAQIATDLLLLTAILRYTGGVESPMTLFYLFHMAIGALLLPAWNAILQGVWALVLFGILVMCELYGLLTPHYGLLAGAPPSDLHTSAPYVASVFAVVTCGVFGMLLFTIQIASRLDQRAMKLRRANAALLQSQRAMHDLQTRRSKFMQTAAHQLKSPLTGIHTLAGLIRDGIVQGAGVVPTSKKIVRRCQLAIEHVGELLALARAQEADPERHRQAQADVRRVIHALSSRHRPIAESRGLEWNEHIPSGVDLTVRVDPVDLSACMENLIENAIKYTPGQGRVSITVTRDGDSVSVSVQDTGMGLDPEDPESLFDAYRRGNNALAAEIPGSGLGLSIVREVVEQAHGRITVHSKQGEGSTFSVSFPTHAGTTLGAGIRNTRSSQVVIDPQSPIVGTEESHHAGPNDQSVGVSRAG